MNRPSLSVASAADPSSGAGRVHDHGHDPDHAHDPAHGPAREHDHARSHGHAHGHAHDHPHAHGPARGGEWPVAAIRVTPSLIRASLATRLALAAAVAAVIWAGVAWALGPIAG